VEFDLYSILYVEGAALTLTPLGVALSDGTVSAVTYPWLYSFGYWQDWPDEPVDGSPIFLH